MRAQVDPVRALGIQKSRLLDRKRELKAEYDRKAAEIDREIAAIDQAMDVMSKAVEPYLCKACGGSGTRRRPDAAGQMEDVTCPDCKGTGVDLSAKLP